MKTTLKTPAEKLSATRKLAETAVMIALAAVLNLFKLVQLPNGGSVTCAAMLPVILIAYRFGYGWGFAGAAVYALIQQLLGMKSLSYLFGWQAVVADILFDFFFAYTVLGLAKITRGKIGNQAAELCVSTIIVCILRYLCHVFAGAVIWGEYIEGGGYVLSIPSEAGWIYSIGYNAVYMIPETVVTAVCAVYVGGVIDFSAAEPRRVRQKKRAAGDLPAVFAFRAAGTLAFAVLAVFDTLSVFRVLGTDDAGRFDFSSLSALKPLPILIVSGVCLAAAAVCFVLAARARARSLRGR